MSSTVSALHFQADKYYSGDYVTTDVTEETIILNKTDLNIEFKSTTTIKKERYEISNWTVFGFFPDSYGSSEDYKYSILLRTSNFSSNDPFEGNKKPNYIPFENKSAGEYTYNISLELFTEKKINIVFNANFTLKNQVRDSGNAEYRIDYYDTANKEHIKYLIPNNFEVKYHSDYLDISPELQSKYKIYVPVKGTGDSAIFILENKDEKKEIEVRKNIRYTLLGFVLGCAIDFIVWFYRKYIRKIEIMDMELKQYKHHKKAIIKVRNRR